MKKIILLLLLCVITSCAKASVENSNVEAKISLSWEAIKTVSGQKCIDALLYEKDELINNAKEVISSTLGGMKTVFFEGKEKREEFIKELPSNCFKALATTYLPHIKGTSVGFVVGLCFAHFFPKKVGGKMRITPLRLFLISSMALYGSLPRHQNAPSNFVYTSLLTTSMAGIYVFYKEVWPARVDDEIKGKKVRKGMVRSIQFMTTLLSAGYTSFFTPNICDFFAKAFSD